MKTILKAFIFILFSLALTTCKKKDKTEPQPAVADPLPEVSTTALSGVASTSALASGNVYNAGTAALLSVGICWDTNPGPTTLKAHTNEGAGTGTYSSTLTALQPNTTYYVRAYATNYNGTAYGNEISFKTAAVWEKVPNSNVYLFFMQAAGQLIVGDEGARSIDNGMTWTYPNPHLNCRTIAIKSNTLWADNGGASDPQRSMDNGVTWNSVTLPIPYPTCFITNGASIYAGTQGTGVYESTDDGNTWTAKNNGLPSDQILYMAAQGSTLFVMTFSNNIYRSLDAGATWSAFPVNTTGYLSKIYVANNNAYIICGNDGIYTASLGGSNWSKVNGNVFKSASAMAFYNNSIFVAVSGDGVYKSGDGGVTWVPMSSGLPSDPNFSTFGMAVSGSYLILGAAYQIGFPVYRWQL
jgi:photosystem II stability/assembly factor-like uncharacterized protein